MKHAHGQPAVEVTAEGGIVPGGSNKWPEAWGGPIFVI